MSLGFVGAEQTSEVEVTTVGHIYIARLVSDLVEEVHIVNRSIGYTQKHWDRARQVDLGVQLDNSFGSAEVCPQEHRKTQIDGRGPSCLCCFLASDEVAYSAQTPCGPANLELE